MIGEPLVGPARSYPPPAPVDVQVAPPGVVNVCGPGPDFVTVVIMPLLAFVVFNSTPEKVGLLSSPPMARAMDVALLFTTLPAPASDPTLWLNPLSRKVALLATETAESEEMVLAMPACSVKPAPLIFVAPV